MSLKTKKTQLLLLFHLKAVHLEAVSNVMHCYDDKDDFALALRWQRSRGGRENAGGEAHSFFQSDQFGEED